MTVGASMSRELVGAIEVDHGKHDASSEAPAFARNIAGAGSCAVQTVSQNQRSAGNGGS